MFTNGQKVVCIDDDFPPVVHALYTALPERDRVYVVRGMAPGVSAADLKSDEIAVYLIGLQNPCSKSAPFREMGFRAERFRPLEELSEGEIVGELVPVEIKALACQKNVMSDSSGVDHPRQSEPGDSWRSVGVPA